MKLVFMFPGQNSRYPGMIERLKSWSGCERLIRKASDVLGRNIESQYLPGNPDMFVANRDVQVGVFLAAHISKEWLESEGFRSDASVGLSLGEYNHLVDIGALSFEDALKLLDARGDAYEASPRGLMLSAFPCSEEQVRDAIQATKKNPGADIGIHLSKSHFVLSGEASAVEAAGLWLEEEAYAQTRVIDPALPMHSAFFKPAADLFRPALKAARWQPQQKAYIPNVDGCSLPDQKPADYADRLYRHIFNTVRWAQCLAETVRLFPDACFVEVGPKCVLYNATRREHRNLRCLFMDDPDSTAASPGDAIRRLKEIVSAA